MKELEEKVNKLYKIVIVLCIVVGIMVIISIGSQFSIKSEKKDENKTQTNTQTQSDYDVSSFKTLSLAEVNRLFEDKKNTYVVYLGRSTCSACVSFLPSLKSMQSKYNYVTQYLDITTVDVNSDDYAKFISYLSKEVTLTVSGETKTQSFGSFYGYTPMTFIVSKGKFVNGIVGAYSESKFEEFLNNNGIK